LVVLQENDINSYHIDTYNVMNFKIVQLYQEIELTGEIIARGEQFIRLEIILNVQGTAYSNATFMIQHFYENSKASYCNIYSGMFFYVLLLFLRLALFAFIASNSFHACSSIGRFPLKYFRALLK